MDYRQHPSHPTAIEVQHNQRARPGIGEICRAPIEAHVDDETSGHGHRVEIMDAPRSVVLKFDIKEFRAVRNLRRAEARSTGVDEPQVALRPYAQRICENQTRRRVGCR
jgi:hypothetical protein